MIACVGTIGIRYSNSTSTTDNYYPSDTTDTAYPSWWFNIPTNYIDYTKETIKRLIELEVSKKWQVAPQNIWMYEQIRMKPLINRRLNNAQHTGKNYKKGL